MPLDPEVSAWLESRRDQPPRSSLTVEQTRAMMMEMRALSGDAPAVARVETFCIGTGLPVRQYWPADDDSLPAVVYFHGGRFFSGNLETHDSLCRSLTMLSGCRVLAVDYRLAPEHPFPAAVEDALSAAHWALGHEAPVALAGDSAGANLAAVAALARPAVRCQLLIYPMLDPARRLSSHVEFATGYGPGSDDMGRGWDLYAPQETDRHDPRLCPLLANNFAGAPEAFVLTAEYDCLRDEGELYAEKLRAAGVPVLLRRFEGMIHGFLSMPGILGGARRAIAESAAWLRDHLGARS